MNRKLLEPTHLVDEKLGERRDGNVVGKPPKTVLTKHVEGDGLLAHAKLDAEVVVGVLRDSPQQLVSLLKSEEVHAAEPAVKHSKATRIVRHQNHRFNVTIVVPGAGDVLSGAQSQWRHVR